MSTVTREHLESALVTAAPLRAEYPFAPHFFATEFGALHYVDEGPLDAPSVLCVHGNPTWSFYFRKIVQACSGELRCVAPDHLGCGLSDKPQDWDYTLRGHIDNLTGLIDELDLRDITLVLHDWGGAIGMGAAVRRPERIARIVLLNTAAFPSTRMPWRIRICRFPLLGRVAIQEFNAFAGLATLMAVEQPLAPEVKRGLLAPYDTSENRIAHWKFVQDIPMSPSHRSYATLNEVAAGLDQFRETPTCLVWGEQDWCFSPHFRREWETRMPHAEVHKLQRAGHYVLEDAPREVLDHLSDFIERHPIAQRS